MAISGSLPDPKGPMSNHLPTPSIAEANKEVLKAVAEAKKPQKKGPYMKKLTPEYKAKVAKFAFISGNNYSKRIVVVVYIMAAVQHFFNKTGPKILVNVISPYHKVDSKGFYF